MPKANELKRGHIVEIHGQPHIVKQVEAKSPSSRGAATLYKIRFTNMKTGQKLDESLKGDDYLKEADCERRPVLYSFFDGEKYVFMDMEDFTQYEQGAVDLEGQTLYLTEGLEGLHALMMDGKVLAIELPQSVILPIIDTAPGIKGVTASGRTKPATLSTGLEIQVPEYLERGDQVKVNTQTGKFLARM